MARSQQQPAPGRQPVSYTMGYSWGGQGTANDLTAFRDTFLPDGGIFSPNYPLAPPEPERLRVWDYPVGYNAIWTPRSYHEIGFAELRALARFHDITRLAIETRKDQIEKLDWTIRPIDQKHPRQDAPPRIAALAEFWRRPDGYRPFATWLRELLEDLLVIDAPTLEIRRNRGGDPLAFDVIDGATIKVLIDATGRTPRPPAPAFEQVIHGRPWALARDGRPDRGDADQGTPLTTQQLVYMPRNVRPGDVYGFSPVEQIITMINIGLRRQTQQLQYFTEGNVPAGLLNAPDAWTAEQIRQFQQWFDETLAGNTGQRTRLIWGPSSAKYQAFKDPPKKDDFDDYLVRVVSYAFSLSPSALVPQVNRATAATSQEAALEEGLAPLSSWVKRLIDFIVQDVQGHVDLEFAWASPKSIDTADQANILDKYVRDGIYSLNEARDELGLPPVAGGDEPAIYTTQGPVLVGSLAQMTAALTAPRDGSGGGDEAGKAAAAPEVRKGTMSKDEAGYTAAAPGGDDVKERGVGKTAGGTFREGNGYARRDRPGDRRLPIDAAARAALDAEARQLLRRAL